MWRPCRLTRPAAAVTLTEKLCAVSTEHAAADVLILSN